MEHLDIYLNLGKPAGERCLFESILGKGTLARLFAMRRDKFPVRIWPMRTSGLLTSGNITHERLVDLVIFFGAKLASNLDAESFITSQTDWTEVQDGNKYYYEALVDFNTAAISTAFAGQESLDLRFDIRLQNLDNTQRITYQFPGTLRKNAILGTEGTGGPGDPIYPLPAEILTKAGNLEGLEDPAEARENIGAASQEDVDEKLDASEVGVAVAELVDGKLPANRMPLEIDATLIPAHLPEGEANDYEGAAGEVFTSPKSVRVGDGANPGGGLRLYNRGQRMLKIFSIEPTSAVPEPSLVLTAALIDERPCTAYVCTGNSTTDVISAPGNNFQNGDCIGFTEITGTSTLAKGNLGWTTLYYVRDKSGDDFKVTLTPGGGAVNWGGTFTAGKVQRIARISDGDVGWQDNPLCIRPVVWDGGSSFENLYIEFGAMSSNAPSLPDMAGLFNLKKLCILNTSGPAAIDLNTYGLDQLEELSVGAYGLTLDDSGLGNLRKLQVGVGDGWSGIDFSQCPLLEELILTHPSVGVTGGSVILDLAGASEYLAKLVFTSTDGASSLSAPTPLPNLSDFTIGSYGTDFTFVDTTGLTAVTNITMGFANMSAGTLTFVNLVGLVSLTTLNIGGAYPGGSIVFPASAGLVGALTNLTNFTIYGTCGTIDAAQLKLIADALVAAGKTGGTFSIPWVIGETEISGDVAPLNAQLAVLRTRGWTAPDLVAPEV